MSEMKPLTLEELDLMEKDVLSVYDPRDENDAYDAAGIKRLFNMARASLAPKGWPSVLDVCCGSKMFWFDRDDPRAVFLDKRKETHLLKDKSSKGGFRNLIIDPDIQADFTALPFKNDSFPLVVFDPPHLVRNGGNGWLAKKYGKLEGDWREELRKGFSECFRILCPGGTLVFKWMENDISVGEILKLTPEAPMFGNRGGRTSKTHWVVFQKPHHAAPQAEAACVCDETSIRNCPVHQNQDDDDYKPMPPSAVLQAKVKFKMKAEPDRSDEERASSLVSHLIKTFIGRMQIVAATQAESVGATVTVTDLSKPIAQALQAARLEERERAKGLLLLLQKLLNKVNLVTCPWRHKQLVEPEWLDELANRQIEIETAIAAYQAGEGEK